MDIVMRHEDLGLSPDELVAAYPGLSLSDVHAALAYYFDNINEIRNDIRRNDEIASELRASFPSKLKISCSMEQIRFYLDEHIPNAVAQGLRRRGVDVLTVQEAGRSGLSDREQLAFALSEQRMVITMDSDFLILARHGITHAGIAYAGPNRSIGEMIGSVCCFTTY
jgi:hypothetical protein